jgi:hypothetical protein
MTDFQVLRGLLARLHLATFFRAFGARILLHYFKIDPLRRGAVLLFGEVVGDADLKDVFAGWQAGAEAQQTTGVEAFEVGLICKINRHRLPRKDSFPVAENARLRSQSRQMGRLV